MPFLDNEKDFFIIFSRLLSAELCVLPSSFYMHIYLLYFNSMLLRQ